MIEEDIKCPKCGGSVRLKAETRIRDGRLLYFACRRDGCRLHFRADCIKGLPPQITVPTASDWKKIPKPLFMAKCPTCGARGRVETTKSRRDDPRGFIRRHKCKNCGPYHSVEFPNGRMYTTKRMPLKEKSI